MDVGLIYGVGFQTVCHILWEVIDAINKRPSVGPFRFPQTEADCKVSADKWQVRGSYSSFGNTWHGKNGASADRVTLCHLLATAAN